MERKYYEAYDDRYRQIHRENLRWFAETPSHIVSDVMQRYNVGGRILEIGCGEGRDARVLLEQGCDLLATDISAEAIGFCRREWPQFKEHFQILNCIGDKLDENFDYIYAVAVLHMLVRQEDRNGFYQFIRQHLKENGIALICTMGDGIMERCSDISLAFELQTRVHEQSGRMVHIAGTSYRAVSFDTFCAELAENRFEILEQGITDVEPDYWKMMYAIVKRADL